MKAILIIDVNERDLQSTAALLAETYSITCCSKLEEAFLLLQTVTFDIIILDLSTKTEKLALSLLESVIGICRATPVLCIGYAIMESIIAAVLKNGAKDFLEKPYTVSKLRAKLLAATIATQSQRPSKASCDSTVEPLTIAEKASSYLGTPTKSTLFLGTSRVIREICEKISLFARSESSVLILGESGTGKELAASEIHRHSKRNAKPFIPADCASIPEHLAESYLFGTEPGAFTGAIRRKGVFEESEGGSLFLDELGELALPIQAKLLRVLESRAGSRMGSLQITRYDVRLISATNSPILNDSTRFRRDLLRRIDTLTLELPPLRVHLEDIPEMAISFLARMDRTKRLSDLALQKLCEWHWPGNVRELKNVVERAAVLSDMRETIIDTDIQTDVSLRWGGVQNCLRL